MWNHRTMPAGASGGLAHIQIWSKVEVFQKGRTIDPIRGLWVVRTLFLNQNGRYWILRGHPYKTSARFYPFMTPPPTSHVQGGREADWKRAMSGRKRRRLGWEREKDWKRPGSREIEKKIGAGERERQGKERKREKTTERKRQTRVGEKGREKR